MQSEMLYLPSLENNHREKFRKIFCLLISLGLGVTLVTSMLSNTSSEVPSTTLYGPLPTPVRNTPAQVISTDVIGGTIISR